MKMLIPVINCRLERPLIYHRVNQNISISPALLKCPVKLRLALVFCRMVLAFLTGWSVQAIGRDYFDPALLDFGSNSGQSVDLSQFETAGGQAPGTYRVDIYVNGTFLIHGILRSSVMATASWFRYLPQIC